MAEGVTRLADHEHIFRRVPRAHFPDRNNAHKPQFVAFLPREANEHDEGDVDGISVIRDRGIRTKEQVSQSGFNKAYHVARLSVGAIHALRLNDIPDSLSVIEDVIDEEPEHALIPELNRPRYESSKDAEMRIKEWARKIANNCCEMVVVLSATPS